jgi:hypothetical protein
VEDAVLSIQRSESLLASGQLHEAFLASQNAIVASGMASVYFSELNNNVLVNG